MSTTMAACRPPAALTRCGPAALQPAVRLPRTAGRLPMWHATRQHPGLARCSLPPPPPPLRRRLPPLRAAGAGRGGPVELLLDAVPGTDEMLSAKLKPEVRERAARAIKARGGRVTLGDVASTAGLALPVAESAVRALAADAQATLQVTAEGEIVWVFPPGFEAAIQSKSLLLRLEPAAQAIKGGLEYALRVAFGTALIVSVVAVWVAITAISSSNSRDDNRRNNSGGGVYYGGGPRMMFDLTDLLWYWDPFYFRHRRERMRQQGLKGQGMNFLEAIFSYVFGDGDPNDEFDKQRWQALGRYIQSRGGTVVAEELAPFLDLSRKQLAADRGRVTVDESYVLPVLARFNGQPAVDAAGNIVYTFPELQQTAGTGSAGRAPQRGGLPTSPALEQRWQLTAASAGQKLGVIALGAVNLLGVVILSTLLADPVNRMSLAREGLLGVLGVMPWLQAYAAAFFAIPAFRWLRQKATNAAIDERNDARRAAVGLLARPDPVLQQKLAGAAAAAKQTVVTSRDVVYSSDRPLAQQPVDMEADSFERRLEQRERERVRQQGGTPAPQQQRQAPWQQPPAQQQADDGAPQWWRQQQEEQLRRAQQQQNDSRR